MSSRRYPDFKANSFRTMGTKAQREGLRIASMMRQAAARNAGIGSRRAGIPAARLSSLAVARAAGTEVKSMDTILAATGGLYFGTGAPNFQTLNAVKEGASFYNRIGRRIRMKSVHIRGVISQTGANAAAVVSNFLGRMLVVYDRQSNGAFPTLADVLTDYINTGGTASTANNGINMNNRDRFLVLADMQICLPPIGINGATAASTSCQAVDINGNGGDSKQAQWNINRFIKLKGIEAHYKANAGDITDCATGGLLIFTTATVDGNATPAYQLTGYARLKFFD